MEQSMKCPHCRELIFITLRETTLTWNPRALERQKLIDKDKVLWEVRTTLCPGCENAIIFLCGLNTDSSTGEAVAYHLQVWPKGTTREPLSPLVPEEFASDYQEACLVLNDSPKASAALGRRCLQYLLREKVGIKKNNLDFCAELDDTSTGPKIDFCAGSTMLQRLDARLPALRPCWI